ncbi:MULTISPECIES: hypothetical protein [Pseudonocardia]|uniref:DUF3311 domain-containing protein n=2 Tax=Pseudonocardia TaxID=1847 RepID=A0A1Y2MZS5_PSEAH|nr:MULTISPECIES: hypothetical protein [Pseudonocardia]OSY40347.1 hypothetical protein BG845_02750 [Pseudonocardia autotrophica]TDN72324.1 hypothetical protein C8E95_1380 [Pseudonocardia autotrophica]BBG03035.1 hypothetical protein Pdca_42440 [Pseudonocardia autotrophica]GEC23657.1 hypothetical protein PSA01_06860 [Pseudonocardia saturnea]
MDHPPSEPTTPPGEREPIRSPWLFAVLLVIVLAGTPVWYPTGLIEPLVFGVPFWFAISVASTLAFAGFVSWICMRRWNIAEPAETAAAAEAAAERGDDR